nr:hypothetical protein [Tanacetum cinerariifolium]
MGLAIFENLSMNLRIYVNTCKNLNFENMKFHFTILIFKYNLRVISSSDDEALDKEDTFKQGRIDEIDVDEDIALVSTHDDVSTQDNIVQDEGIEDVGEEEVVEVVTTTKMIIDVVVDVAQDKGKGKAKLIEEPKMPKKRKNQIRADEELAKKLQAKIDEENRIAIEKDQQVERLQVEEQEQLTDPEKAKLFMEFLEKERQLFAAKRDEERRNKPTTKAQQRSLIAELVDGSSKKAELEITQEDSLKRAGDEMEQETTKKQKIVDDKETTNLKQLVKIIPKEDIAIDAIPLAIKTLTVDWKIYKEGKKSYYQIIRAGGKSKNYLIFSHMLNDFDREDVESLWRLVKAKYGSTRPEEDCDKVL